MPELPEVEVTRKIFNPILTGKKITQVTCRIPKMVEPEPKIFTQQLKNAKILNVTRRAKMLILNLDKRRSLWIHFKLTGQLVYQDVPGGDSELIMGGHPMETVKTVPNPFTHVIFEFSDGSKLFFNDLRKFGYIKLIRDGENQPGGKLGIEPLSPQFTFPAFNNLLSKRPRMKIKQFLLDQSFVVGLGNIYVDEVLFFAGIHPTRQVQKLLTEEKKKIYAGIKKILALAIKSGSTSYNTYIPPANRPGNYNAHLMAYQRHGEACRRDGVLLKRIRINGRSTHFCPECQK